MGSLASSPVPGGDSSTFNQPGCSTSVTGLLSGCSGVDSFLFVSITKVVTPPLLVPGFLLLSSLSESRSTVCTPPNAVSICTSICGLRTKPLDSALAVLYSCLLLRRFMQRRTNMMMNSAMATANARAKATSPYVPNGDRIDSGA